MTGKKIFVKISNDRAARFCTVTSIIQDQGEKYVLKEPENPLAEDHVRNIENNGKLLAERYQNSRIRFAEAKRQGAGVRVSWVEGRSFEEYLDDLLEQGDTEACIQAMTDYFSQIFSPETHEYRELPDSEIFFESDRPAGPIPALNGIDIDMLFQNVIYSGEEGIWTDYDYEWVPKCDVPVKFLIYRCLNYYLVTEKRMRLLGDQLYSRFQISEKERETYGNMEAQLQSFIAEGIVPLWRMYERIGGSVVQVLPMVERRIFNRSAEVFFDRGQGFSAEDTANVKTQEPHPGLIRAIAEYPEGTKTVRFDPAQSACVIQIEYLRDSEGRELSFSTNGSERESGEYLFLHNDPQIFISVDGNAGSFESEYRLNLIDAENTIAQNGMLAKVSECEQLSAQLEENKRQNEDLINQNKNLKTSLSEKEQLFLSVTESTTWKLTEPLRKAGRSAARVKARRRSREDMRMRERYLQTDEEENTYQKWIETLERQDSCQEEPEYQPKISVLVPVYNVLDKHLIPCIESVLNQTYQNWELCMADDCSTWENVRKTLRRYEKNDKVKVVYRNENGHISRSTNSALEMATGEYIAFLDCDDVLAPNALYEVARVLNEDPELDFIYSDEDKIDDDGKSRFMPHFKSDWAPDTLMEFMYTCHLGVYRRRIAEEIGGLRVGFEGAQDYDFVLRFTEKTDKIAHISKILYHWRVREESTAGTPEAKPYILEAAKRTQEEALARRNLRGEVELVRESWQYRVNYLPEVWPKVSVVIPSKDNYEVLKTCLDSFHELTDYPDYEIILVDNGSDEENRKKYQDISNAYGMQYIYHREAFNFSHMCNLGGKAASGELLLFLNDDIEIIDSKWLKRMAGQAALPHVGAVGAKLLYPDGDTIQHAGVINLECGPSHAFTGFSDKQSYSFGRNRMDYNYLAVTAACLLVGKEKFERVSGFNEELAVAYNDIEFCFHLAAEGYYNVVRNDAVLLHHESLSRGLDREDKRKFERLVREREKLYSIYPQYRGWDPFYNRNLVQNNVDFSNNSENKHYIINEMTGSLKITKRMESDFHVCLDEITFSDFLYVKGWFFFRSSRVTNSCDVYVVLNGKDGRAACYNVKRTIRKDAADASGNAAFRCGFECRIRQEDLEGIQENSQIGILVEMSPGKRRRIRWTSAKTERCLANE
ncbi:MAG: glycosyltransferase [Clostridiales bacterium]|nr:glycosyltransferase [Clostridiales bacterium]